MKKMKIAAALLALATAAGISGCSSCGNNDTTDDNTPIVTDYVSVSVSQASVTVKDYEVSTYNFARYFSITDNGTGVSSKNYVDVSGVLAEAGEYEVVCTYGDKTAKLKVIVTASEKNITLSKNSVRINSSEVADYDFKSLFTLTVDGSAYNINESMITTDVRAEAGEYTYTVSFFGATATLKVTVIDEHAIEIINSYSVLELTLAEIENFDFTKLFSLYVGGAAEKILSDYIDVSGITSPQEGKTYPVTMSFEKNDRQASSTAYIKIVEETQISITANNIVTYPNGDVIDLTKLFTVKNGNQIVEVTDDMITGTVDYSVEGDNVITLEYGGRMETAIVSIKLGVIIGYAASDTVLIEKGTDINGYDFGSDFTVIINGIRFNNLPPAYFDLTDVDFSKEGEYTVKLSVPYNTKSIGLSGGVNFDYFEKTITYQVVENKTEYTIDTIQKTVVLPAGTSKYGVYDNLSIVINGIRRMPYEDKNNIDITTCYVQTVSEPIDFSSPAEQVVEIDVYVYGPDADPVRVAYTLRIENGVEVYGMERVVFSGTTVYARDLFTIIENGAEVTVTDDMVSGKIDLFNAGIYFVTATYKGVTAQSKAVVLDSAMAGTYKTLLTEIEPYSDSDDSDYEDMGWGDYTLSADYATAYSSTAFLQDFVIDTDGEMYLGSNKVQIISIIDDSTFNVQIYSYRYVMRYGDGILTFDPVNSERLAYNDRKRPMVYFNTAEWSVGYSVQINSSSYGYNVLQTSSSGNLLVSTGAYTIELMQIKSVESGEYFWYGMKTTFITKSDADTYYDDEIFGFATLAPGFEPKAGSVSSVRLGGESYDFTMQDSYKAIINKAAVSVSAFAGINFRGTVDGKDATFTVASNDRITFTVDGVKIFDLSVSEQNSIKNCGIDYGENTWLVYNMYLDTDNTPYSYRFRLDAENKTFTVDEADDLFGRYVYDNVCFFFDGYGTGEANFDTESKYMTTAFSYKINGANIEITYLNPDPAFAYGKTAKFIFADYKNVLTVREITGIDLVGAQFINAVICDGAIVEVNNFVLGKGVAEKELFEGISIITKDGVLTAEQMQSYIEGTKTKYVDTSLISFSRAGFYQLKINIPVNGGIKTAYYAVQILDDIYSGSPVVGRYSQSAVNSGAALILDEYGRISGEFAGITFSGNAYVTATGFTATANSAAGIFTITGTVISDGIILVTARGSLMFTDCFTTGTVKTCGTDGYILRVITVGDKTVCFLANAVTSVGSTVLAEGDINALGTVIRLYSGSKEYFVKVTGWNGTGSGLVLADALRGVYTLEGADDLILDGFGTAMLGTKTGAYTIYASSITVISGIEVCVYKLNTINKTYTVGTTPIDGTLFAGKSYSAEYNFFCENEGQTPYKAVTVFEFKADGKVTVKSSSDEHDEDCSDTYNPEFATASGIEGTYSVAGNLLTVKVNGKTIVFTFTDAVGLNTVTCSSTDVSSISHGYFNPNTEFALI